jgi:hypothetical protein
LLDADMVRARAVWFPGKTVHAPWTSPEPPVDDPPSVIGHVWERRIALKWFESIGWVRNASCQALGVGS